MNFKKKLLFLLTEDWFFCSHFLERAVAAKNQGYKVIVCAKKNNHKSLIEDKGIIFKEVPFNRRSLNLITEIYCILCIFIIYLRERPDIVHQVSFKPIVYGSLISRILKVKSVINAPVGMGYVYSSNDVKARLLKPIINFLYKLFLCNQKGKGRKNKVIFENENDLVEFINIKALKRKDAILIQGAGVDFDFYNNIFKEKKVRDSLPVVALVGRMIRDKGVYEFIESVKILKSQGVKAKFLLVGDTDSLNPSAISRDTLSNWNKEGLIEWVGWIENIPKLLNDIDILCLPSYREGLPKILVEGTAMRLPIVTTRTVGCKDVVKDNENGFLVPVRNTALLANAIQKLIYNPSLRKKMGLKGYSLSVNKFSSDIVITKTLNLYEKM